MSSPWNKDIAPEPIGLQDIMLEELTKSAQEKENKKYGVFAFSTYEEIDIPKEYFLQQNYELKSDEEFAKMLQYQYDKGYCDISGQENFNSESRMSLTSLDDKETSISLALGSDDEELEDMKDKYEWDKFGTILEEFDPIPVYNYTCDNGNLSGKNNVFKLSDSTIDDIITFPWHFVLGTSMETKLAPRSFKNLSYLWYIKEPDDEEVCNVYGIEIETKMLLYHMIKTQLIDEVNGLIRAGEETLILHAYTNPKYPKCSLPTDCIIKIFKTMLSKSKRRDKLIAENYRFQRLCRRSGETNTPKIAAYWAQQEMRILQRLQKAGIACPEVITIKRNILVMSYLNSNENNKPAPKLRDANLDLTEMTNAYKQIVHYMKIMFNECNLIHGDLSATNVLWYNNKCYLIDVGKFIRRTHEKALPLLYNDCKTICNFFINKDVSNVSTPEELFEDITGYYPKIS